MCLSADVEFNVSGMFAMPTPLANHTNHLGASDFDSGTIERKRPGSMVVPEGDSPRKDRYPSQPRGFQRQDSKSNTLSALYVVSDESITVSVNEAE